MGVRGHESCKEALGSLLQDPTVNEIHIFSQDFIGGEGERSVPWKSESFIRWRSLQYEGQKSLGSVGVSIEWYCTRNV